MINVNVVVVDVVELVVELVVDVVELVVDEVVDVVIVVVDVVELVVDEDVEVVVVDRYAGSLHQLKIDSPAPICMHAVCQCLQHFPVTH